MIYSFVGDPKFGWRRTDLWAGITLPRFKEADFERDFEPGAANLAYPDSKFGFLGFSFNLLSFSYDILIWSNFF